MTANTIITIILIISAIINGLILLNRLLAYFDIPHQNMHPDFPIKWVIREVILILLLLKM